MGHLPTPGEPSWRVGTEKWHPRRRDCYASRNAGYRLRGVNLGGTPRLYKGCAQVKRVNTRSSTTATRSSRMLTVSLWWDRRDPPSATTVGFPAALEPPRSPGRGDWGLLGLDAEDLERVGYFSRYGVETVEEVRWRPRSSGHH